LIEICMTYISWIQLYVYIKSYLYDYISGKRAGIQEETYYLLDNGSIWRCAENK